MADRSRSRRRSRSCLTVNPSPGWISLIDVVIELERVSISRDAEG